jgi:hypothetical protein
MVQELCRVLAPGGVLVIKEHDIDQPSPKQQQPSDLLRALQFVHEFFDDFRPGLHVRSRHAWRTLFESSGLVWVADTPRLDQLCSFCLVFYKP